MSIQDRVKAKRNLLQAATYQAQSLRVIEALREDETAVMLVVFPSADLLRFVYSQIRKALPSQARIGILTRESYPYEKRQIWQQWDAFQLDVLCITVEELVWVQETQPKQLESNRPKRWAVFSSELFIEGVSEPFVTKHYARLKPFLKTVLEPVLFLSSGLSLASLALLKTDFDFDAIGLPNVPHEFVLEAFPCWSEAQKDRHVQAKWDTLAENQRSEILLLEQKGRKRVTSRVSNRPEGLNACDVMALGEVGLEHMSRLWLAFMPDSIEALAAISAFFPHLKKVAVFYTGDDVSQAKERFKKSGSSLKSLFLIRRLLTQGESCSSRLYQNTLYEGCSSEPCAECQWCVNGPITLWQKLFRAVLA